MSIKKSEFEILLTKQFPHSTFEVTDTSGDEDHYRVKITSPEFTKMTRIQKHRLVNTRLKDYIGTKIHAVEFIIS
ncbi:MAG: stress-induced morphogen [Candidatus Deianiraeaceae bacterium]|jgi:stress-induced morphogen